MSVELDTLRSLRAARPLLVTLHPGWFHEWLAQNADKTFTFHRPTSGPLSRSRAAQARLPRPSCVRPVCWSSHESHRPALVLLRATVRGAPNLQSTVHPTTTLVCWQVRRPPTARAVAILRHHHPGARHGPPARPVDEQGAAHTACPPRTTTTQPTHRLLSVDGRRPLDAALEAVVLDVCQAAELGCSVAALWSSRRPPCSCLGVRRGPGRPAPEVRTAVGRRAG